MSLDMRKPAFCICENKDADQLRGDREADQRLCFRYLDSSIPLLPKPGLCGTWSETSKIGFLTTRLKSVSNNRFQQVTPKSNINTNGVEK